MAKTEERKLILPKEQHSPVDYFFEEVGDPYQVHEVILTQAAYERMKTDEYIKLQNSLPVGMSEEDWEQSSWQAPEGWINGKYYPIMSYVLVHKEGMYYLTQLTYGTSTYFYPNTLRTERIIIDYEP